jgi:hypothetical protein
VEVPLADRGIVVTKLEGQKKDEEKKDEEKKEKTKKGCSSR